ncbi:MAG: D-hexose-6-phosphate mutarotase [Actinobacteria bacterium]|nr:D-hexose-6-phosphate mutarotase [Actinomycetota bacterium]
MPSAPFPGIDTYHLGDHYAVLDAGAQVLQWTPTGHNPVLWVSPLASFEPGVAVRGGVPVVFPWFGAGPQGDLTPSHGFARTAEWRRTSVTNELVASGRLEVRHVLDASGFDSPPFEAELVSTFTPRHVSISLVVTNTGTDTFRYEEALHTYLGVSEAAGVTVEGLDGCRYLDKADGAGPDELVQEGSIRFDGEVDRVYAHTGDAVIDDPAWSRRVHVAKEGSANTVVWNPGERKGTALADVGRNWPDFVCIEAGNVRDDAIELAPRAQHILTQTISLS